MWTRVAGHSWVQSLKVFFLNKSWPLRNFINILKIYEYLFWEDSAVRNIAKEQTKIIEFFFFDDVIMTSRLHIIKQCNFPHIHPVQVVVLGCYIYEAPRVFTLIIAFLSNARMFVKLKCLSGKIFNSRNCKHQMYLFDYFFIIVIIIMSFIYSFNYSFIHSFIDVMIDLVIDWLIDWLTDWLMGWLIVWLIGWLVDWLIDWLTDWLIDRSMHLYMYVIQREAKKDQKSKY